jgi:GTPase SAR1 family protein
MALNSNNQRSSENVSFGSSGSSQFGSLSPIPLATSPSPPHSPQSPIKDETQFDFFFSEGKTFFVPKEQKVETFRQKIVVLGSRGSGKSTYINSLLTEGWFNPEYSPTNQLEISIHEMKSSKGNVITSFFDSGACSKEELKKESSLWKGACGFLIFFDLSKENAFIKALKRVRMISKHYNPEGSKDENKCPPIALCGNKFDLDIRKETFANMIDKKYNKYYRSFNISTKINHNFYEPFLFLLRNKLGNDTTFELPEREVLLKHIKPIKCKKTKKVKPIPRILSPIRETPEFREGTLFPEGSPRVSPRTKLDFTTPLVKTRSFIQDLNKEGADTKVSLSMFFDDE